jgi:peroxiredoxin Q/BCP
MSLSGRRKRPAEAAGRAGASGKIATSGRIAERDSPFRPEIAISGRIAPVPSPMTRRPGARLDGMTQPVRLQPGDEAPDFSLATDSGKTLSLKELRGRKVVLYAYPAAMTPGCTTQACDFRDNIASLKGAGYEVVGISPDTPAQLAKFRERDALTFPLVADEDRKVLTAYGAYGEKQLYGKTVVGVLRSTFVIDEKGRIEKAMYNVKATGHVAKLRRDLGID